MEEEAHNRGRNSKHGHKWSEILETVHFLESKASEQKYQAVSGISHTHRKE